MRTITMMFCAVSLLGALAVPAQAQYQQQRVPQQRVQPHYNVPQQRMPVPQQRVQPRYNVPQQRMAVPQQRVQPHNTPQMRGGYQQRYVQPRIQQRAMISQQHIQRVQQPAFNRHTGQWGQRMGRTALVAATGAAIWYSLPDYEGPAYVNLPGVGMVEMDDRYESIIYPDLASGDPDRIASAIALIEGSAMVQGLMEMEESDGD